MKKFRIWLGYHIHKGNRQVIFFFIGGMLFPVVPCIVLYPFLQNPTLILVLCFLLPYFFLLLIVLSAHVFIPKNWRVVIDRAENLKNRESAQFRFNAAIDRLIQETKSSQNPKDLNKLIEKCRAVLNEEETLAGMEKSLHELPAQIEEKRKLIDSLLAKIGKN